MPFPFTIIDLSHTITPSCPTWDEGCGFNHHMIHDYAPSDNDTISFRVMSLRMPAGMGTHMDAPSHCVRGGQDISDLDLATLAMPCAVLDVSQSAQDTYRVSIQDIHHHEALHGQLLPGSCVMIHTGWERYWHDPARYRNNLVFPCVSKEAAELLLARNIRALGIDTLSPDRPEHGYDVHSLFLNAGKVLLENVAGLSGMPPCGGYVLAMPLKLAQGTESPLRLIGLIPKDGNTMA